MIAPELTESTLIISFENFTIAKSTFFNDDKPAAFTFRILNYNLTIEENLSDNFADDCVSYINYLYCLLDSFLMCYRNFKI